MRIYQLDKSDYSKFHHATLTKSLTKGLKVACHQQRLWNVGKQVLDDAGSVMSGVGVKTKAAVIQDLLLQLPLAGDASSFAEQALFSQVMSIVQ